MPGNSLRAINWGKRLILFVSWLSGITVRHCLMPKGLKTIVSYIFAHFFCYFRKKSKFGLCYSILARSEIPLPSFELTLPSYYIGFSFTDFGLSYITLNQLYYPVGSFINELSTVLTHAYCLYEVLFCFKKFALWHYFQTFNPSKFSSHIPISGFPIWSQNKVNHYPPSLVESLHWYYSTYHISLQMGACDVYIISTVSGIKKVFTKHFLNE